MVILKPVCDTVMSGTQVRSPLGCSDYVAMRQMDVLKQFRRPLMRLNYERVPVWHIHKAVQEWLARATWCKSSGGKLSARRAKYDA